RKARVLVETTDFVVIKNRVTAAVTPRGRPYRAGICLSLCFIIIQISSLLNSTRRCVTGTTRAASHVSRRTCQMLTYCGSDVPPRAALSKLAHGDIRPKTVCCTVVIIDLHRPCSDEGCCRDC